MDKNFNPPLMVIILKKGLIDLEVIVETGGGFPR